MILQEIFHSRLQNWPRLLIATKRILPIIRSIKSQIQNSFPWRSAAKYLQKRKKQERHYWQSARTWKQSMQQWISETIRDSTWESSSTAGVRSLSCLWSMNRYRKFIWEQMPWEISPVSIIFWKAIRRNWQKRSNDWKRYRSSLQMPKRKLESHSQKKRNWTRNWSDCQN